MTSSLSLAEVRLFLVDLDGTALDAMTVSLSVSERERASRLKSGAAQWRRSRGALRHVLGREFGIAPAAVEFEIAAAGKPRTRGMEFSLSHSGRWALIGLSSVCVGVDIERIRDDVDYARIGPRFLCSQPRTAREFFRLWTSREAYVKATGEGIAGNLGTGPAEGHCVVEIPAPEGYSAAVAVLAPEVRYSFEEL